MTRDPAPRSAAGRLEAVRRFVARLGDARHLDEVLATVDEATREALGVQTIRLALTDRRRPTLVSLLESGPTGRPSDDLSAPVPLAGDQLLAQVARTGEPLMWSSVHELERLGGAATEGDAASEVGAVLPLIVDGDVIGVLMVGWADRRRLSHTDTAMLRVLAQQCAVAVDRARLEESDRAERDTLDLLNEAIRILVGSLDPTEIVPGLVRLAVPKLAPWCAVYVAERTTLRRVAIEIAGDRLLAADLQGRSTLRIASDMPLALSYRTGETLVVPVVTSAMVRHVYEDTEAARIATFDDDRAWTALVVPVKAEGRVLGVMSLVSRDWGGDPPEQVRYAAEGLAGRAGIAISNAASYERARLTAALLTEALLPTELPPIPGYEVATRYIPSAGQVAGDWFDVAHLPSGAFLLGIGDVTGVGMRAAALMAQLRNAARGLAVGGESPAGILHGLALLVREDETESLASAIYALLDPADGEVRWASAGHLAPLLWSAGDALVLPAAQRPTLGLRAEDRAPEHRAPEHSVRLGAGDAFVLVSDGVLERRSADFAERFESLRSLVARYGGRPAASLAELLVNVLCDEPEDDCCVLVLKRH